MMRADKVSWLPVPSADARGRSMFERALEQVWYHRQLTRASLAQILSISRSTASEVVAELLDRGLVVEAGDGPSQGGRRPILVAFRDDSRCILGVEMGASHVEVCLTDLRGQVICHEAEPYPVRTDPHGSRSLIMSLCERCLSSRPESIGPLLGIGIAVPAPVDIERSLQLSPEVLPAWEGQSGFESIEEHFGVPVLVDNDANLGAVAERWWGDGQGIDHLIFIKLATGIGAGMMIDGQVYRGATNAAGEIGHISIDRNGAPCVCGNLGCLVTFAGAEALVARACTLLDTCPESCLHGGQVTPGRIEQAALNGDPVAQAVIHEVAQYLGVAIAGLLNALNPRLVILGGSLSQLGDQLLSPLRQTVAERTLLSSVSASRISASRLGPTGIALGAATSVLASALADPTLFSASHPSQQKAADR